MTTYLTKKKFEISTSHTIALAIEFHLIVDNPTPSRNYTTMIHHVRWEPPKPGTFKLHTDGAVMKQGKGGIGERLETQEETK